MKIPLDGLPDNHGEPGPVERIVAKAPGAGLRVFYGELSTALTAHWETGDAAPLVQWAHFTRIEMLVWDNPEYQVAILEADLRDAKWRADGCPPRKGRPVAEVFAELRAQRVKSDDSRRSED